MIKLNRASLAIHRELLSRDEITRRLGIEPSTRKKLASARRAVWTLDVSDDPRESGDETGMGSLGPLEALVSNRVALASLHADCDLRIWWSGDSDSSHV